MYLFSVRLLSVLQVSSFWSFVFFHPCPSWQWPPTSKYFYPRFYPLHYILILEKEPVFPFLTSLVWRGPWLGIEPWTSRTWSQHYYCEAIRGGGSHVSMIAVKDCILWSKHPKHMSCTMVTCMKPPEKVPFDGC